jgi:hypothetical protein
MRMRRPYPTKRLNGKTHDPQIGEKRWNRKWHAPVVVNMGETSINVAGVRGVAGEFDSVAEELQKAIQQLRGLSFGGASAGRWHTAKGDAVRDGLREVVTHLENWQRTNTAIAEQLRATAQRYADRDAKNKARVAAANGR